MLMHWGGGVAAALLFFYFFSQKLKITNQPLFVALVLTASFAAFIGVLWEFFEFFLDIFISETGYLAFFKTAPALAKSVSDIYRDTLSDLFFDILGGATAAFIAQWRKNKVFSL